MLGQNGMPHRPSGDLHRILFHLPPLLSLLFSTLVIPFPSFGFELIMISGGVHPPHKGHPSGSTYVYQMPLDHNPWGRMPEASLRMEEAFQTMPRYVKNTF